MGTDAWGVTDGFDDAEHVWHDTPPETRAALYRAMDAGSLDAPRLQREVCVIRSGKATPWKRRGLLRLEDGTELKLSGSKLPADLPLGYHEFEPDDGSIPTRLIVTPGQCPLPPGRQWGWAVQLYATRSRESWGLGDLNDLARIGRWAVKERATMLMVNPLGSAGPLVGQQPSPYYPSTRRFKNPLYLRIEDVPGAGALGSELDRLVAEGRALNADRRIDRSAVFALKQEALRQLWKRSHGAEPGFEAFRRQQGAQLEQFATYCAISESQQQSYWRMWPEELRRPDHAAVTRWANDHADQVAYHAWLQWLVDEQLAKASQTVPLMHDLPIGVDPGGADGWAWQDILANGTSVGAPPDVYNNQGQDWGLPPFVPHKLREAGYEPFIQTIRASLRHAGALRIDHVMGLFRLYWIPHSMGPKQGAFVRYRADEMLAIVALESHRAGAYVVGEDLGTVEDGVREQLAAHRVLSYRLLWFEDNLPPTYPSLSMVAATTHDLPTVAGLWTGKDLADQQAIGLKPSVEAANSMRDRVARMAGLVEGDEPADVVQKVYSLLAQAPSLVVTATLEDALAVEERINMPGTVDQWPNWSVALPGGIEALETSTLARAISTSLSSVPRAQKARSGNSRRGSVNA